MQRAQVDLANLALSFLVRDAIRDPNGSEPAAVQTRLHSTHAVEFVIEQYDWPTSRVVSKLTQVSGVYGRGWAYVYALPADVIKVWNVGPESINKGEEKIYPFEIGLSADITSESTYIFSDQADAYIRYGSSRTPLSRMTPAQYECCALKLAQLCCLPLAKSDQKFSTLTNLLARSLSAAKTSAGNTEPDRIDTEFVPDVIANRFG